MANRIFSQYQAGLGNAASYQVSGRPWITGSVNHPGGGSEGAPRTDHIKFPSVAKSVTVFRGETAPAYDLRVHFASGSDVMPGRHYISIHSGSQTFAVKCTEIWVSNAGGVKGSYEVFAELTGIDSREMINLTGSGITDWLF